MEVQTFLDVMHLAERLKDAVRHSYSSGGRRESVAEHSWRITLMAFFLRDEFPEADMNKVMECASSMTWENASRGISPRS